MKRAPWYEPPRGLREAIFARDGGRCQIRGIRCTEIATQIDHIVPVRAGGAWFDPDNLRAACQHCNYDVRQVGERRTSAPSRAW